GPGGTTSARLGAAGQLGRRRHRGLARLHPVRDRLGQVPGRLRHRAAGAVDRAPRARVARRATQPDRCAGRGGARMRASLLVSHWQVDPTVLAALAAVAALYLLAAARLRARWPW